MSFHVPRKTAFPAALVFVTLFGGCRKHHQPNRVLWTFLYVRYPRKAAARRT